MAFVHKVQFCWFMVLAFIILLTLKLDGRINSWNWFIVFIPMWLLDSVVIVFTFINMILHCKNRWWLSSIEVPLLRKAWCMCNIVSKLIFEVLLCLRLQYITNLGLYIVMIPFWIFNGGCIIEVSLSLFKIAKRESI